MSPSQGMAASLVQLIVLHLGMGSKFLQISQFIKRSKKSRFLKKGSTCNLHILDIFFSETKQHTPMDQISLHIPNLCLILNISDDIHQTLPSYFCFPIANNIKPHALLHSNCSLLLCGETFFISSILGVLFLTHFEQIYPSGAF